MVLWSSSIVSCIFLVLVFEVLKIRMHEKKSLFELNDKSFNPSHAAIKISINATAAEFICKNIFPIPVQIKKIIKNKTGDIQQIYLYQNVCK